MKLVLQRAIGDCGIAALATLLEQTYEDVYVASAKTDHRARGKSGITTAGMIHTAKLLGVRLVEKRQPALDEDDGILVIRWRRPQQHPFSAHLVVLTNGVIVDPAEGWFGPHDEYLARFQATTGALLETA